MAAAPTQYSSALIQSLRGTAGKGGGQEGSGISFLPNFQPAAGAALAPRNYSGMAFNPQPLAMEVLPPEFFFAGTGGDDSGGGFVQSQIEPPVDIVIPVPSKKPDVPDYTDDLWGPDPKFVYPDLPDAVDETQWQPSQPKPEPEPVRTFPVPEQPAWEPTDLPDLPTVPEPEPQPAETFPVPDQPAWEPIDLEPFVTRPAPAPMPEEPAVFPPDAVDETQWLNFEPEIAQTFAVAEQPVWEPMSLDEPPVEEEMLNDLLDKYFFGYDFGLEDYDLATV